MPHPLPYTGAVATCHNGRFCAGKAKTDSGSAIDYREDNKDKGLPLA